MPGDEQDVPLEAVDSMEFFKECTCGCGKQAKDDVNHFFEDLLRYWRYALPQVSFHDFQDLHRYHTEIEKEGSREDGSEEEGNCDDGPLREDLSLVGQAITHHINRSKLLRPFEKFIEYKTGSFGDEDKEQCGVLLLLDELDGPLVTNEHLLGEVKRLSEVVRRDLSKLTESKVPSTICWKIKSGTGGVEGPFAARVCFREPGNRPGNGNETFDVHEEIEKTLGPVFRNMPENNKGKPQKLVLSLGR